MTSGEQAAHLSRAVAESFGVDAGRYDRSRPRYPDEAVAAVLAAAPGRDVLDVGIGTGILGRQFRAAGATVLGVEPDARMAEHARGTGLAVEVARIEDWDPAGRRFDAVVSGQAWHWVDPVTGPVRAAAALRPGGVLALLWNVTRAPAALEPALAEVYLRELPDSPLAKLAARGLTAPQAYDTMTGTAMDGIRAAGSFTEPETATYQRDQPYTRDEWLAYSATTGITTRLPADELERVLSGLGAVIDAAGGSLICHHTTVVLTATRRA